MHRDTNKNSSVFVHAIATQVPEYVYEREYSLLRSKALIAKSPAQQKFLERVFRGSEIQKRHSVVGDFLENQNPRQLYPESPDFLPEPSTAKRNQIFGKASRELSYEAVHKIFEENPRFRPDSITHLVTVSCTGFQAPGFDYHLIQSLRLKSDIVRYHLGFMGCYAAFPALKLANEICSNHSEANVLVVHCELCSLHLKFRFDPDTQVANAIFADGCSAAIVSAAQPERKAIQFQKFASEILPASEQEMTWDIGDLGFEMRLSSKVPSMLKKYAAGAVEKLVLPDEKDDLLWAIHPGGKAILDEWEKALNLSDESLLLSRKILSTYGNMSSATIYFVLQEYLKSSQQGNLFAAAFGPGLTMESALMKLL